MTVLVNCTPHEIVIQRENEELRIPASGIIPRVNTVPKKGIEIEGFRTTAEVLDEPVGLPEPQEGKLFIVSRMVLDNSSRRDLIAPDTGSTAIRNELGRIIAVTGFITKEG